MVFLKSSSDVRLVKQVNQKKRDFWSFADLRRSSCEATRSTGNIISATSSQEHVKEQVALMLSR